MAATAAHLTDHVIPAVPVRQWVLSAPKRIRYFLHRDPKAAGAVLHILLRALRRTLHDCSPGAGRGAKFGAVSFLHRFGASLNPHFHYHLCVLDGVYEAFEEEGENSPSRSVRFHEATALTRADVEALQETVRRRVLRHRYHGMLAPNSPLRSAVVASAGEAATRPFPQTTPPRPVSTFSRRTARSNSRRVSSRWAALLARIHHARPLVCPECGEAMRLIAFLTDPFSIQNVLDRAPRDGPDPLLVI